MVGQWQGGFQADVTVTAGGSQINGYPGKLGRLNSGRKRVTWTFANGQTVTQSWGAEVASSGPSVTADNAAWNGTLAPGASTTFGIIGSSGSTNNPPTLTCTPR